MVSVNRKESRASTLCVARNDSACSMYQGCVSSKVTDDVMGVMAWLPPVGSSVSETVTDLLNSVGPDSVTLMNWAFGVSTSVGALARVMATKNIFF